MDSDGGEVEDNNGDGEVSGGWERGGQGGVKEGRAAKGEK